MLRIVDSFGTEPAYNHRDFARRNKLLTTWGGQDLHPQQFFTMFRKHALSLILFKVAANIKFEKGFFFFLEHIVNIFINFQKWIFYKLLCVLND